MLHDSNGKDYMRVWTSPRVAKYSIMASHKPWLPIRFIVIVAVTKKTRAAIAEEMSMPRVCVVPMKRPSQMKAATPAAGIR